MGKGSDEEAIERKIGNAALGKDLEYIQTSYNTRVRQEVGYRGFNIASYCVKLRKNDKNERKENKY